jgi:hypothetical protein
MNNGVWLLPVIPDGILDGARFSHIDFDKLKIGMMQKWDQGLPAEEK